MPTQVCHTPNNNNAEAAITYPIPPADPSYSRIGIQLASGSDMIQSGVTNLSFKLRNYGSATGNVYARCDASDGSSVAVSNPIDITTIDNTIPMVYHQFTFSSSFDTSEGDYLSVDTGSVSGSYNNWLTVSLGNGTEFDDRAYKYNTPGSDWDALPASHDLAICMTYSGSTPSSSTLLLPPPIAWI